jgi:hypothetical protein
VLTCLNPKYAVPLGWVGGSGYPTSRRELSSPWFTLPGPLIPGPSYRLSLAYSPYVRLLPFGDRLFFPK